MADEMCEMTPEEKAAWWEEFRQKLQEWQGAHPGKMLTSVDLTLGGEWWIEDEIFDRAVGLTIHARPDLIEQLRHGKATVSIYLADLVPDETLHDGRIRLELRHASLDGDMYAYRPLKH